VRLLGWNESNDLIRLVQGYVYETFRSDCHFSNSAHAVDEFFPLDEIVAIHADSVEVLPGESTSNEVSVPLWERLSASVVKTASADAW
jgi:hypothetical protein